VSLVNLHAKQRWQFCDTTVKLASSVRPNKAWHSADTKKLCEAGSVYTCRISITHAPLHVAAASTVRIALSHQRGTQ
jgi:hypothetical protein